MYQIAVMTLKLGACESTFKHEMLVFLNQPPNVSHIILRAAYLIIRLTSHLIWYWNDKFFLVHDSFRFMLSESVHDGPTRQWHTQQ